MVLARQPRLGEDGRRFVLLGFPITPEMRSSGLWRLLADAGAGALPQLWNVLRGDLSIVGPRPRMLGLTAPPARPGLTGPAQVEALQRPVSAGEAVRLEQAYARDWSLRADARIVVRTLVAVFR